MYIYIYIFIYIYIITFVHTYVQWHICTFVHAVDQNLEWPGMSSYFIKKNPGALLDSFIVIPPGFGHHSKFFLTGIHLLTGAYNPANVRFLLAPHSKFCFWQFCAVYTVFRVFPSAPARRSRTFIDPRRFPSGHSKFRSATVYIYRDIDRQIDIDIY